MAGYTALIALTTGLIIWFFSAVKLTHRSMLPPLSSTEFHSSFSPMRLRQGLTLLQVALSVALVCAATLFAHSLYKLLSLETGFNPDNLQVFPIRPAQVSHDIQKNEIYFSQLLSHFKSAPGVESASVTTQIPMMGRGEEHGFWAILDGLDPTNQSRSIWPLWARIFSGFSSYPCWQAKSFLSGTSRAH
jgi:hypothetical protein